MGTHTQHDTHTHAHAFRRNQILTSETLMEAVFEPEKITKRCRCEETDHLSRVEVSKPPKTLIVSTGRMNARGRKIKRRLVSCTHKHTHTHTPAVDVLISDDKPRDPNALLQQETKKDNEIHHSWCDGTQWKRDQRTLHSVPETWLESTQIVVHVRR